MLYKELRIPFKVQTKQYNDPNYKQKTQTYVLMIVPKYFSLAVFLIFLFTLETLQSDGTRFQKEEKIRYLETNDQELKDSDQLEDVYLAQKYPYKFGTVLNEGNEKVQTNEFKKRSFIIDGRSSKSSIDQNSVQYQRINVVIKLKSTNHTEISAVIKQLSVEKQQWNQDKGQFYSTVFAINQLTMDRHNQFYSILLPILDNGKYKIIIVWKENQGEHFNFSIAFYLVNLSDENYNTLSPIQPVDLSETNDTIILPYGQTISLPILSPNYVAMVELQSCSFSIPSIFYSLNNTKQMQELKDHDQQSTIFLIKNHKTPYNPSIYLKYVNSPQVYFHIQSSQKSLENRKIVQNPQFHQFLVRINKNTRTHFKNFVSTNHPFSQPIYYEIKGSDMEITYKRLYPSKSAFLQLVQNPLSSTKIVYKLYLSSSQSALAKKQLCGIDTYEEGKNVIVMQKVIEQQSISGLIEQNKQKNTLNSQSQEIGTAKISLWDIRKNFQNAESQLYLNMKVTIKAQSATISSQISESQKLVSQKVAASKEIFYYQPIKVRLVSSDIWLFLWDLKFSKLMWVFIIISLCILFVLFFFQSIYKGWINRKKIPDESISPRIVIKKPKKSLSDSYGFNPSPPGSSNIIKIYETSGGDQIIENEQTQSKSEGKLKISNQLSSPPLV